MTRQKKTNLLAAVVTTCAVSVLPFTANAGLIDGSFEETPSGWTYDATTPPCTPNDSLDKIQQNGSFAKDGTKYFWAGGFCWPSSVWYPVEDYVYQNVTIDAPSLSFYFQVDAAEMSEPDWPYAPYGFVRINGDYVWSLLLTPGNETSDWEYESIDVSGYLGSTVQVSFGISINEQNPVGANIYFDNIMLTGDGDGGGPNGIPEPATLSLLGLGLLGMGMRRRQHPGLLR